MRLGLCLYSVASGLCAEGSAIGKAVARFCADREGSVPLMFEFGSCFSTFMCVVLAYYLLKMKHWTVRYYREAGWSCLDYRTSNLIQPCYERFHAVDGIQKHLWETRLISGCRSWDERYGMKHRIQIFNCWNSTAVCNINEIEAWHGLRDIIESPYEVSWL